MNAGISSFREFVRRRQRAVAMEAFVPLRGVHAVRIGTHRSSHETMQGENLTESVVSRIKRI